MASRERSERRVHDRLSIGEMAARSGIAVSALRFYEAEGLLTTSRTEGGQRQYERAMLRRVAFIRIAQRVGLSLDEIRAALVSLPSERTPTKADWAALSASWRPRLEEQISVLCRLRDELSSCIGCGCLSLARCKLYNPDDRAATLGSGPRYLLGDEPVTTTASADKPAARPTTGATSTRAGACRATLEQDRAQTAREL